MAAFFHLFFRVAAIVTYVCCDWFSKSSVGCFVTVLLLLSFDFWSVKVGPAGGASGGQAPRGGKGAPSGPPSPLPALRKGADA